MKGVEMNEIECTHCRKHLGWWGAETPTPYFKCDECKAPAKSQQLTLCESEDHCFMHVETTSTTSNPYAGLVSTPTRVFKLYCCKCGEVRAL